MKLLKLLDLWPPFVTTHGNLPPAPARYPDPLRSASALASGIPSPGRGASVLAASIPDPRFSSSGRATGVPDPRRSTSTN